MYNYYNELDNIDISYFKMVDRDLTEMPENLEQFFQQNPEVHNFIIIFMHNKRHLNPFFQKLIT